MNHDNQPDPLEMSVHALIVLGGAFLVYYSYNVSDTFFQALWLNIGSNLVVVTMLFAVFEVFRRRRGDNSRNDFKVPAPEQRTPQDTMERLDNNNDEARASAYLESLRAKQRPPITSNSSKVIRKK